MKLPNLPRPSLPWVLLLFIAFGAATFGTVHLLVVEVVQWGILIDAELGSVPPGVGIRLETPRHNENLCDSLQVELLYPTDLDSAARRMHIARQLSFSPALRLDEAFRGRPELMISGQWGSLLLPSLTVRSNLPLPLGMEQDFPVNALNVNSREGRTASWKLGPLMQERMPRGLLSQDRSTYDAGNRLLIQGNDSVGSLSFEALIPSPAQVRIRRTDDSLCFFNQGSRVLHDFVAISTAMPIELGGRIERLEPGQSFCLTEPGKLPDPRAYAIRQGMGEVSARAFAAVWEQQRIANLPLPLRIVQWSAWLDPAALDSIVPLRVRWPLTRIRRHVLLVHREPILDSSGCPERQRPLPDDGVSETIHLRSYPAPDTDPRLQQAATEHLLRMQQGTDAPRIGHNSPMPALELGQLRWEGNPERSEASVLQVLRANIPGLGHILRKAVPGLEAILHKRFTLHFTISPEGQVIACEVVGNLPSPLRDEIRDKVCRYRFPVLQIRSNATVRIDVEIIGVKFPHQIGAMDGS